MIDLLGLKLLCPIMNEVPVPVNYFYLIVLFVFVQIYPATIMRSGGQKASLLIVKKEELTLAAMDSTAVAHIISSLTDSCLARGCTN